MPCDELSALQQLGATYWARADGQTAPSLAEIFTANATLVLGSLELAGLEAIERFFRERDASQLATQRTTRHIACNHRAVVLDEVRIRLQSTVLVYVGTGSWPLPSSAPAAIADFEDICIRNSDGRGWRFERREGRTVFIGPDAASFAR